MAKVVFDTHRFKVNAKGEVFYVVPVPEKELSIFQVNGKIMLLMMLMMMMKMMVMMMMMVMAMTLLGDIDVKMAKMVRFIFQR